MTAREELRKPKETALDASREAERISTYYATRAKALQTLLETCSDQQISDCYERIKKEAPSVLPS